MTPLSFINSIINRQFPNVIDRITSMSYNPSLFLAKAYYRSQQVLFGNKFYHYKPLR